ncbi:MAG: PAS domain-containing protein [Deferribacterales bacterium]
MDVRIDTENIIAGLKEAINLIENGGSRTELSNSLLHIMGGGFCDLHCITTDATFLQKILDMLPVPVYYKDIFGVYIGCNEALADLYERSKDQIIGKTVFDIFSHEEAEVFTTSNGILVSELRNELVEHRGKFSAMGNSYHVIHKKIILTSVGTVAGILGIILDVSEHKESEERAWQGEAFYKALYENSPRARIVYDCFNIIEDMNFSAINLFKEGDTLIGRDVSELFEKHEDFQKVMESNGKTVKVNLLGLEEGPVEVLASLTTVSALELPKYAVSVIRMDSIE